MTPWASRTAALALAIAAMPAVASEAVSTLPGALFGQTGAQNPTVRRGQAQLEAGEFEDAIRTIEIGLSDPDLSEDTQVELYRLLGLAYLYLGDEENARGAYEKLLQARPDYELPRSAPPKIRDLYARIKEDVKKRRVRPVTLQVANIAEAPPERPLTVTARIDNLALGARAKLYFRRAGRQAYSSVDFGRDRKDAGLFRAQIPAYEFTSEGLPYEVEYYVEVADAAQRRLAGRGDPLSPLSFRVTREDGGVAAAEEKAWYQSPWVWVGAGVLVAGATAGVIVLASQHPTGDLPIRIQVGP